MQQLESFTEQGLNEYAKELEHQIAVEVLYDDAARTEQGKFIKTQLEHNLNYWLNQYGQINPAISSAPHTLSFIQGVEYCLRRLISHLENAGKQSEDNRNEIKRVRDFIGSKRVEQSSRTFIPEGYKKESTHDRARNTGKNGSVGKKSAGAGKAG